MGFKDEPPYDKLIEALSAKLYPQVKSRVTGIQSDKIYEFVSLAKVDKPLNTFEMHFLQQKLLELNQEDMYQDVNQHLEVYSNESFEPPLILSESARPSSVEEEETDFDELGIDEYPGA